MVIKQERTNANSNNNNNNNCKKLLGRPSVLVLVNVVDSKQCTSRSAAEHPLPPVDEQLLFLAVLLTWSM
jgi:hypothetical protein